MINSLSEEFKKILNESDWMDADSKRIALEKVAKTLKFVFLGVFCYFCIQIKVKYMDSKIAYADQIYNDTYLNGYYEEVGLK